MKLSVMKMLRVLLIIEVQLNMGLGTVDILPVNMCRVPLEDWQYIQLIKQLEFRKGDFETKVIQ